MTASGQTLAAAGADPRCRRVDALGRRAPAVASWRGPASVEPRSWPPSRSRRRATCPTGCARIASSRRASSPRRRGWPSNAGVAVSVSAPDALRVPDSLEAEDEIERLPDHPGGARQCRPPCRRPDDPDRVRRHGRPPDGVRDRRRDRIPTGGHGSHRPRSAGDGGAGRRPPLAARDRLAPGSRDEDLGRRRRSAPGLVVPRRATGRRGRSGSGPVIEPITSGRLSDPILARSGNGEAESQPSSPASRDSAAPREPVRVALVDDHHLVREGLRLVLMSRGFDVVGESPTAAGAFQLVDRHRPDVLLLDLSLGDADGLTLLRELRSRAPETKIVVVVDASRSGDGPPGPTRGRRRLPRQGRPQRRSLRRDRRRGPRRAVSPQQRRPGRSSTTRCAGSHSETVLTAREREILEPARRRPRLAEVGRRLGISPHTVRRHIANLSSKLGTRGTAALVSYAIREGLVRESSD